MIKPLVIANGAPPSAQLVHALLETHEKLIAVDGGLHTCLKHGLEPQLIIGDFDSISEEMRKKFAYIPQMYVSDQNKSDLEKTLAYLFDSGAEIVTVCGAIGNRVDHTLFNMHLLSRYPEKVKFETDTEICFALSQSSTLACQIGQTLSLIPMSTEVKKIFTQGLKWDLDGTDLSKHFVSISNICRKTTVSITFEEGDLIACLLRI